MEGGVYSNYTVELSNSNDRTFQRNISQHCWGQHFACVWLPCCDMLGVVGSNLKIFHNFLCSICGCCLMLYCSRLARFVRQCCAWACALVRFSTRNMSQHVATGWPNACNMLRPWQTRTHCCRHIVAHTNVAPFARTHNICSGYKFCVRDTKHVSDFV